LSWLGGGVVVLKFSGLSLMPRGGPRFASRKLSIYSRRKLAAIDGRTLEARRERQIVAELTEHVGGAPSTVQRILIARASRLLVTVENLEKQIIEGGEVGDLAGRQVLAWVNSLRQILSLLGIERPQQMPKRLADVLKVKAVA
jgi:hypothetical protein